MAMIIDNLRFSTNINPKEQITVITPFLEQQYLLAEHLKPYDLRGVMTIDKCQGLDCDIVILSCAKQTEDKGSSYLLRDLRRLNVALTRAKKMLIIIGAEKHLRDIRPFE